VQAGERQQEAAVEVEAQPDGVLFRYTHDELPLETRVRVHGMGEWSYREERLSTGLSLARQQCATIRLEIRADDSIGMARAFAWHGDRELLERHWDAARRILD